MVSQKKAHAWWRYNPIYQKPIALEPVKPWSWFYYYGPDPAAGVSYGHYKDNKNKVNVITESKQLVYSPVDGGPLHFVGLVEQEVLAKAMASCTAEYACGCGVAYKTNANTSKYCVGCGSLISAEVAPNKETKTMEREDLRAKVKARLQAQASEDSLEMIREKIIARRRAALAEKLASEEAGAPEEADAWYRSDDSGKAEGDLNKERKEKIMANREKYKVEADSPADYIHVDDLVKAVEAEMKSCGEEEKAHAEEKHEEEKAHAEEKHEEEKAHSEKACAEEDYVHIDTIMDAVKAVAEEEQKEHEAAKEDHSEEKPEEEPVDLEYENLDVVLDEAPAAEPPAEEVAKSAIAAARSRVRKKLREKMRQRIMARRKRILAEEMAEEVSEVKEVAVEEAPKVEEAYPAEVPAAEKAPTHPEDLKAPMPEGDVVMKDMEAMRFEPLAALDVLAHVKKEQIDMVLFGEESENPTWHVSVAGVPACAISLKDQNASEEIRKVFCSEEYAADLVDHCEKAGFLDTMKRVAAKFWANHISNQQIADRFAKEATAKLEVEKTNFLKNFKEDFLGALAIVTAGANKNFFQMDNALKDCFFANLTTLGLPEQTAVAAIEKSFKEGAAEHFQNLFAKAEEIMGLNPEARTQISKAIMDADVVPVQAKLESAESTSLAHRLAVASVIPEAAGHATGIAVRNPVSMDTSSYKAQLKSAWRRK